MTKVYAFVHVQLIAESQQAIKFIRSII